VTAPSSCLSAAPLNECAREYAIEESCFCYWVQELTSQLHLKQQRLVTRIAVEVAQQGIDS
jgi:hypothetical protein